ncbi:TraK family protein [Paracoccus sp. N5]|uniref:TraK family protein n=1 Tax=Paracoccus sp. N5 TaxID=1101189 RepID=UPI00036EF673|nr:TraK family protein [Paracoccus sp. N5]
MVDESKVDGEVTKSFRDELAAWVAQRDQAARPKRRESLAAFLVVRADVIEATAAGYALKTIWEHLHEAGRVSFRYETFLKHVRRHITNPPTEQSKPVPVKRSNERESKPIHEPRKVESVGIPSFHYNPRMEDKDLI